MRDVETGMSSGSRLKGYTGRHDDDDRENERFIGMLCFIESADNFDVGREG